MFIKYSVRPLVISLLNQNCTPSCKWFSIQSFISTSFR